LNPGQKLLDTKIKKRLAQRLKAGLINEVRYLHSPPQFMGRVPRSSNPRGGRGLSWHRLESFGLEYKFVSLYLQKKLSREEMFDQLFTAIKQYSKRQRRWWKRNKEINWISNFAKAALIVEKFLKSLDLLFNNNFSRYSTPVDSGSISSYRDGSSRVRWR